MHVSQDFAELDVAEAGHERITICQQVNYDV